MAVWSSCRSATTWTTLFLRASPEVQVTTSSFSAHYGIGGAVFNQISKSGTNGFHGSLYEYWQNSALERQTLFRDSEQHWRFYSAAGRLISGTTNTVGRLAGPS